VTADTTSTTAVDEISAPASAPAPSVPTITDWKHLPALDGLRAAAVIAVLIFHAGYLQGGFLGVDLFFALSGFLITSLLIRDATSSDGTGIVLGTFWGRRFRRLLPAVFTMITVVALWAWIFGSGADLAGVQDDGPWAVAYLANWHFIAESGGYWESFAQPSMFDHLWSLAIEEQFYLLWPIVLVAIWKWSSRPTRTLLVLTVSAVALSFLSMILLYDGVEPTRVYMGTDTRAASLLVGALAATEPARRLARRAVVLLGDRTGMAIAALVVFVGWSWFAIDGASSGLLYRGGLLVHSIACAVIISLVVALDRGWLVRGFALRPLVWIGVLSYGLYLWHWPVYIVLSPERTGLDGVALLAVRLGASALIAYTSFRLVEDPIRRRARWALGPSGLVALVASVVAISALLFLLPDPPVEIAEFNPAAIAVPVVVPTTAGESAAADEASQTTRPPNDPAAVAAAEAVASVIDPDVDLTPGVTPVSETTATTAPVPQEAITSVLWAGDSVAHELGPAVDASLSAAGLEVDVVQSYPGFRLISPERSDIDLSKRLPARAAELQPDVVLLQISNWDGTADSDQYRAALVALAEELEPLGTKLVVVATPTTWNKDFNADHTRMFEIAANLADDPGEDGAGRNIAVLDPRPIWGEPGVLDLNGDGTPERKRDGIHICPSGAAMFGAWLADALAERFDGVTPGDPAIWADALWVVDERYDEPVGACAPL
jgi:peptidoglycan/LPS O-acetylase OafA/YrhL/lysophospholipase L1-like esterase